MNIDDLKREVTKIPTVYRHDIHHEEVLSDRLRLIDHLHAQGHLTPADDVKALRDAVRGLNEYAQGLKHWLPPATRKTTDWVFEKHADTIKKCEAQK